MNNTTKTNSVGKVFIFKQEWFDVLSEMSAKVRLQVYEAVMMYQATGEVPEEMSKVARMAFFFIRKEIDQMNGISPAYSDPEVSNESTMDSTVPDRNRNIDCVQQPCQLNSPHIPDNRQNVIKHICNDPARPGAHRHGSPIAYSHKIPDAQKITAVRV